MDIILFTLIQETGKKILDTSNNIDINSIVMDLVEPDSESEEEELMTLAVIALEKNQPKRIENYVENIVRNYNSTEFQHNFRLERNAFEYLHAKAQQFFAMGNYPPPAFKISLERQLLAVIWLLATPESFRSVGERFDIPKSTLSVIFFRIIKFINKISQSAIRFPTAEEKVIIKQHFLNTNKLSGVIGAVDGTYIPVKVPQAHKAEYTNRKFFTSVTLQAVCDHRLKYIDCFIGYPSSVHDNRIFRNSPLYKAVLHKKDDFFQEEEKILGDKAYPLEPWCITPFIDRGRLTHRQKTFNKVHASARVVIERSFALLFGRFRRLRYIDMNVLESIPATILAACVLHNICIECGDENITQYIADGAPYLDQNIPVEDIIDQERHNRPIAEHIRENMMLDL